MIKPFRPSLIVLTVLFAHATAAQQATQVFSRQVSSRQAAMAASAPRDPSLKPVFAQFGGKPGLIALMDDLMDELMADKRTRPYFEDVDRAHIKAELVDQFCVILDGPCKYTGKDMERVHRKLGINQTAFYALVEDLQLAMNRRKVPFRAQNKLLAKLAPMHAAVVTK